VIDYLPNYPDLDPGRRTETMGVKFFQVDAFAEKPFRGNPAAVCLLSGPGDPAWMQNVAKEMNEGNLNKGGR
jgi:hypothetical protein